MTEIIEHNILLILFLPVWICLFILVNCFVKFTDTKKLTFFFTMFSTTVGLIFSSVLLHSILFSAKKTIETSALWLHAGDLNIYFGIYLDNISALFLFILMAVCFCVHLFSYGYMKDDKDYHKYFLFLNFFSFAMSGVIVSSNLIQTYIFWELVGVASYLLIGFWYKKQSISNAAKRVFLVNRLGDFALLLGIIILVYYSICYPQTFDQYEILAYSNLDSFVIRIQSLLTSHTYVIICMLLLFGAFVKSAQFPFQTWLIDAMKAPTPVSALIHSATMVCLGVFLVLRLYPMFIISDILIKIILYTGLITALTCALFALPQRNIKKMLAYSTSSQLGLMFASLGMLAPTAAIFYMCTHAFTKASLFLITGRISKLSNDELNMNKLGGLRKNNFLIAMFWFIAALSLSGMCFAGFVSKETLYTPFFCRNNLQLFIILIIISLCTSIYIFKAYFKIFEGETKGEKNSIISLSMGGGLLLITLMGLSLTHIFNPENLKLLTPQNFYFREFYDTSLTIILLSISFLGLLIGYFAFKYRNKLKLFSNITAKFLYRGAYIDVLFKNIIGGGFLIICTILKYIDEYILDGVIKLTELISTKASYIVRKLQNGNFQTYIAYSIFSIGIILFLAFQIYVYIAKELQ